MIRASAISGRRRRASRQLASASVGAAEFAQQDAEVVVYLCRVGAEAQRVAVAGFRLVQPAARLQGDGEVQVRAGVLRPQAQAAAEAVLCLGDAAEMVVDQPQAVVRIGKRRVQPQCLALVLLGFLERAGGHAGQAEIGPGRREIGAVAQGGAIMGFRFADLAGAVQVEAALETGAGVAWRGIVMSAFHASLCSSYVHNTSQRGIQGALDQSMREMWVHADLRALTGGAPRNRVMSGIPSIPHFPSCSATLGS